ncbi:thiaminase II [Paenibacillus albiflavus]|nr:thiaminase II [Paenibacillus albiflavus]
MAMIRSLSAKLREINEDLFQQLYEHPFVAGIRQGSLSKDQLIHYVQQDHLYLNAYIQLYAMAITKVSTREDMTFFHQGISYILNDEVQPHHVFCEAAGVSVDEIKSEAMASATRNYRNHMFTTAQFGTVPELYAAMLPCPWTYEYIAKRIMSESPPAENHPYYQWITFYAKEQKPSWVEIVCSKLDVLSANSSEAEQLRVEEAFRVSCQMEYQFWTMAYQLEA